MSFLPYGIAAVVLAIAALHALWGLRIWWPVRQETALARTVTGFAGATSMPSAPACFAVATALAAMAVCIAGLGDHPIFGSGAVASLLGVPIAAIFLGRGLIAYTPFWARLTPEQPFRALDRRVYSPLCIAIGTGISLVLASSAGQ